MSTEIRFQFEAAKGLFERAGRELYSGLSEIRTRQQLLDFSSKCWPKYLKMVSQGQLYFEVAKESLEEMEPVGSAHKKLSELQHEAMGSYVALACAMQAYSNMATHMKTRTLLSPQGFVRLFEAAKTSVLEGR